MLRIGTKGTGPVKQHFLGRWLKGYGNFMKFYHNLKTTGLSEVAQRRLEALKFLENHGLGATLDAFKVSRASLYSWRRTLSGSRHNSTSLIPKSTRPLRVRRMVVDEKILAFIRNLRENNHRLGKAKIKILLDVYCAEAKLPMVSVSLIGKIIKRNNWFFPPLGRVYHNPSYCYRKKLRPYRQRLPRDFKARSPGEFQIDTITRFDLGTRRYIFTAVDLFSRFSFASAYERLNSTFSFDFFKKLEKVSPFAIRSVKTDNGLEFLGEFDRYLAQKEITHYFSYPRTPESNAFVERFNRTLQEEFVEYHLDDLPQTNLFNRRLIDYLLYFNQVRPHQALAYQTPLGYLVSQAHLSRMSVTSTRRIKIIRNLVY